ncbi:LOW QUALITY PROTEIN: hypothetical protein V2J09_001025 [Rumex salicifolius]
MCWWPEAPYQKTLISKDFLRDKVTVSFPDGEDGDPNISIQSEVIEALSSVWHWLVVLKLLGHNLNFPTMERKVRELWKLCPRICSWILSMGAPWRSSILRKTLTAGPWKIFGRCLVVQWTLEFRTSQPLQTTPLWIRIQDLPKEHILLAIASGIGNPIKVDPKTLYSNMGRFVRICVEVNLEKPLKGMVLINGDRFLIEYEGLPAICYDCVRFGHVKTGCPYRGTTMNRPLAENQVDNQGDEGAATGPYIAKRKPGHHWEWMDESWKHRNSAWRARKGAMAKKEAAEGPNANIVSDNGKALAKSEQYIAVGNSPVVGCGSQGGGDLEHDAPLERSVDQELRFVVGKIGYGPTTCQKNRQARGSTSIDHREGQLDRKDKAPATSEDLRKNSGPTQLGSPGNTVEVHHKDNNLGKNRRKVRRKNNSNGPTKGAKAQEPMLDKADPSKRARVVDSTLAFKIKPQAHPEDKESSAKADMEMEP